IRIPIHGARRRFATYKISRRFDQDISSVCGAYWLDLDGTRVRDIRICYGGMAATPKRARRCEQTLGGGGWTRAAVERAMAGHRGSHLHRRHPRATARAVRVRPTE